MNKIKKVEMPSILEIIILIIITFIVIISFIKKTVLLLIILLLLCFLSFILKNIFDYVYQIVCTLNKDSKRWCKPLSKEELEIVEDAKKLIKKVDNRITISEFNVYKIRFGTPSWFYYDESTKELNIFIPFENLLWFGGKDLCFIIVLHEVLHTQNLKNNLEIFKLNFLEGMNELLTEWLIEKYSEKYKLTYRRLFLLRLINALKEEVPYKIYPKEKSMAKEVLEKSNADFKKVFLNYIDLNHQFFREFIPKKYLKKQK